MLLKTGRLCRRRWARVSVGIGTKPVAGFTTGVSAGQGQHHMAKKGIGSQLGMGSAALTPGLQTRCWVRLALCWGKRKRESPTEDVWGAWMEPWGRKPGRGLPDS